VKRLDSVICIWTQCAFIVYGYLEYRVSIYWYCISVCLKSTCL